MDILSVLIQFLFRLTCGLALGMLLTDSRKVASGFFRNHLYVTLGFMVFAALVAGGIKDVAGIDWFQPGGLAFWAAVVSYFGAVAWLYEAPSIGRFVLSVLSLIAGVGGIVTSKVGTVATAKSLFTMTKVEGALWLIDPITSSWLLGGVFCSMLLGHWYLNAPGMNVAHLQKLIRFAAVGAVLRLILWCVAFALEWQTLGAMPGNWTFWTLHGGAGLALTLPVLWMTWETLKIPNTQSATGILYVGVILTFLGEVAGLLVSKLSHYPL